MNTRELRIGNYYQAKSPEKKEYEPKYRLDSFSLCQAINNEINLKPIPITEEWLLKFGFENWVKENDDYYSLTYRPESISLEFYNDDSKEWTFLANIEFVHELQNLFFALTGVELEIKKGDPSYFPFIED